MHIERAEGFWLDTDKENRVSIGIESERLVECMAEATRRKAWGVFGNATYGFKHDNLDFLNDLPHLGKVWFWDVKLSSIEGIYAASSLRHFGVHRNRPPVDFTRLKRLQNVTWFPVRGDQGIAQLPELDCLHVWHYNPRLRNLEDLEIPTSIRELRLTWSNTTTLEGLPLLPSLRRLVVARCRSLESIAALASATPQLEHLVVTTCPRVKDGVEVVKRLPQLHHAFVRDVLMVSDGVTG